MIFNDLSISLLIPTLNAGARWIDVLESIRDQSVLIKSKIIIDSGSSDETINLALRFGFKVVTIDKSEFNHGGTRQKLIGLSDDSDICVFITQDAILASVDSILNIIKPFQDQKVGMAYGRQLAHINATPLEMHARLYNYPPVSQVVSMNDMSSLGFKVFFCSNSFSAYRKTSLDAVGGFPSNSIMGEDAIVAGKMLISGYKKAYAATAAVYHSHSYTIKEEFKRYFDTRVFHEQNRWLTQAFGTPTGEGLKYLKSEIKYAIANDFKSLFKSLVSLGAKWLGYHNGRYYTKFSTKTLKKLSMHKHYWK